MFPPYLRFTSKNAFKFPPGVIRAHMLRFQVQVLRVLCVRGAAHRGRDPDHSGDQDPRARPRRLPPVAAGQPHTHAQG